MMASIVKLPDPENAPAHSSAWLIELSAGEVTDVAAGGAAVLTVILPISDPLATVTIRQRQER